MNRRLIFMAFVFTTSVLGCGDGPVRDSGVAGFLHAMAKPAAIEAAEAPPQGAAVRYKVKLQVQSETWRKGEKPFDIGGAIRKSLEAAGVDVVETGAPGIEGTVLVVYKESKANMFPGADEILNGTEISINLMVLSQQGKALLRLAEYFRSAGGFTWNSYELALGDVKESSEVTQAGAWVRAALGSAPDLRVLLPEVAYPRRRAAVLGLIERLKFAPTAESDRAWLLVGRQDFEGLVRIGGPAIDPLLAFLKYNDSPKDSANAAAALARIGTPRAAKPVVDRAIALGHEYIHGPDELAYVLSVFQSAGSLGDAFGLVALEDFSQVQTDNFGIPSRAVKRAAAKAAADIRARLFSKTK